MYYSQSRRNCFMFIVTAINAVEGETGWKEKSNTEIQRKLKFCYWSISCVTHVVIVVVHCLIDWICVDCAVMYNYILNVTRRFLKPLVLHICPWRARYTVSLHSDRWDGAKLSKSIHLVVVSMSLLLIEQAVISALELIACLYKDSQLHSFEKKIPNHTNAFVPVNEDTEAMKQNITEDVKELGEESGLDSYCWWKGI